MFKKIVHVLAPNLLLEALLHFKVDEYQVFLAKAN